MVADEAAFWHSDESANPDIEILNAVRPSLGTTGGPLVVISSPYARRGAVWDAFRQYYGPEGDRRILVARGSTRDLNPSYAQEKIDREYERDPAYAAAEFGGEFRTDIESFITVEAVQACTDAVRERAYDRAYEYTAFVDPSGGSHDSFVLAISHKEGKTSVLDLVREVRPPFSPEGTVENFCSTLRVLQRQLVSLERRTARGGRDSIDHPPGGKDDVANAVAGALVLAGERPSSLGPWWNVPAADLPYPKLGIV